MGFFDRFKKIEAPQKQDAKDISLMEVEDFYQKKFSQSVQDSEGKIRQLQTEILSHFRSLPLQQLENARFEKDDKRYAAVNMAKNTYVTKLKSLLSSLPQPGSEYAGYGEFLRKANSLVQEMKNASPKQAISMSTFFKSESEGIVMKVKQIDTLIQEMQGILSPGNSLEYLFLLSERKKSILSLSEKQILLKKRLQEKENERKTFEEEKMSVDDEFQKFLSGSWKESEQLDDSIKNLEAKMQQIQYMLEGEFAVLRRPLKKAKHLLKESVSSGVGQSSFLAFMENPQSIQQAISLLQALSEKKKISLKEHESQKIVALAKRGGELDALKGSYIALQKQVEDKKSQQESSSVKKQKKSLEEKSQFLTTRMQALENDLENLKRSNVNIKQEALSKRKDLEEFIKKQTGDDIRIRYEGI